MNVGVAGPTRVSAGDLDGDGMPDLVIGATNDDKIYILRNISTPGSLSGSSFEAPFSISTPSPATVAIADLDLDGRPELIVPTISTNTVSVFRNISTPGSLTAASFTSNVGFTADMDVNFVAPGDLDRDGKPELVVSHSGATAISILRNTHPVYI